MCAELVPEYLMNGGGTIGCSIDSTYSIVIPTFKLALNLYGKGMNLKLKNSTKNIFPEDFCKYFGVQNMNF